MARDIVISKKKSEIIIKSVLEGVMVDSTPLNNFDFT